MTTLAVIYTRVSSDEQAREGLSLDAQLAACRRHAVERGWIIRAEYQDVMSGKRDDRPQYQRLLTDVRQWRGQGRAVAVVVAALDRFGRRLLERVRSREEFKALGVAVHSIREGGEVNDLMANFLAVLAEEESRRLGERIRETWTHVRRQGYPKVGRVRWGYLLRDATPEERAGGAAKRVLDEDPACAPFLRETFRRVAAGDTIRTVARWLAALPTEARGGRSMSYSNVNHLLKLPMYAARPETGADDVLARPVQKWPALVDDRTWATVQGRIELGHRLPAQASGEVLLSGLMRCPVCAGRMSGWNRTRQRPHYRCNQAPMKRCCFAAPRDVIDRLVLDEVSGVLDAVSGRDAQFRSTLRRAWEGLRSPAEGAERRKQVQALERDAERSRKRLTDAALLLVDGKLDALAYGELRMRVQAEMDAAEAELARLRGVKADPTLPPLDEVLASAGGWREMLCSGGVPTRREVLGLLLDAVVPERVGWGRYDARLAWTPTGAALAKLAAGARRAA
jgi:site-specific DNA recombinase